MGKLIISEHITLDGYMAGINGEMDWIGFDDELFDFVGRITDSAGGALYGRKTYEIMDAYWPIAGTKPQATKHDLEHSAWYSRVDRLVLSRTMQGQDTGQTRFITSDDLTPVTEMVSRTNVVVFGSPSAVRLLLDAGLVDEMHLFVNPVTLGSGVSMWGAMAQRQQWLLAGSNTYVNGKIIGLHYTRTR